MNTMDVNLYQYNDMDVFPDEILIEILSKLPYLDKIKSAEVCTRWLGLQRDVFRNEMLYLHDCYKSELVYNFIKRVNPPLSIHTNGMFVNRTIQYKWLNLNRITQLELFCIHVSSFPPLDKLPNLTYLVLHDVRGIKPHVDVSPCKYLKRLEISTSDLQSIQGMSKTIQHLNLSNNKLVTLPPEIANLTNLGYLDLEMNAIKHIQKLPNSLVHLKLNCNAGIVVDEYPPTLESLYLEQVEMDIIPPTIFKCTHLKSLSLPYNNITEIPSDIQYLTRLEDLNLCYNNLESVPIELGKLIHLTFLSLGFNKLTDLPLECIDLVHLDYLNIEHNEFTLVPECIKYLPLKGLDLSSNHFTTFPDFIYEKSTICDINLTQGNRIPPLI